MVFVLFCFPAEVFYIFFEKNQNILIEDFSAILMH